jgi:D-arabinose 1-dehydrogenase-like Zn-dependent alcohol dehydrogenase
MRNGGYVIVVGAEIVGFIVSAGSSGHGFKTGRAVGEAIA